MSAIYEQHKDEDGFLDMTYAGEDIIIELLFTTRTSLDIVDSITTELKGPAFLEEIPNTFTPYFSQVHMLLAICVKRDGPNTRNLTREDECIPLSRDQFFNTRRSTVGV